MLSYTRLHTRVARQASDQHAPVRARSSRGPCVSSGPAVGTANPHAGTLIRRQQAHAGSSRGRSGLLGGAGPCRAAQTLYPSAKPPPAPTSSQHSGPEELSNVFYEAGGLNVKALREENGYTVLVEAAEPRPMVLHWAINDWEGPPEHIYPPNTHKIDEKAVQTPFEGNRQVRLSFSKADAPERIVFVLKELQPENWINNGSCYSVQLKPAGVSQLVQRVLDIEGNADHWSLKDRFVLANDVLDGLAAAGADGMSFLFTWLRMSSNKILTWARRANYQSKDIAWMQKVVSERMTDKARSCPDPWARLYARLALAGLPRGGGNGDDIRMGILHIMREYGIKEGHRPGHDEPFLEQWHQKLHQNTTPEDVTICEAYLAYLHSGNHDDYWRVLWDNGKITKERLESMHNPIKGYPIDSTLEQLLVLLKGEMPTTLATGRSSSPSARQPSPPHNSGDGAGTTCSVSLGRQEEQGEDQIYVDHEQLRLTGLVCSMAVPCLCNNPACTNTSGPTELSLVSGRNCVCGGCRVAHYCSRARQSQHWKQHKPVCRTLAAAKAAAAELAAVA